MAAINNGFLHQWFCEFHAGSQVAQSKQRKFSTIGAIISAEMTLAASKPFAEASSTEFGGIEPGSKIQSMHTDSRYVQATDKGASSAAKVSSALVGAEKNLSVICRWRIPMSCKECT